MDRLISLQAALDALSTWDKFGCDADGKLVPYKDDYIPYIHYDDVVKCIKGLPSVSTENPNRCGEDVTCTDAISRQDVIDAFEKRANIDWERLKVLYPLLEEIEQLPSVSTEKTGRWIPVSVIEDIKADIKSEYVSLRHRTDEDIELGECMGLKIALGIIDSHTVAKMVEPQESEVKNETCD